METHAPIETQAITVQEQSIAKAPATPDQLLALAVDKNLDIDKLAKLMDLQREYNKDLAKKAFFHALTEFQIACPEIRKGKKVSFNTTSYNYAPLADIDRQIKNTLKEYGLSKRWEIQDTKEDIKVTCIITHIEGHSEQTTMSSGPDASGGKNSIQARASAIEYMKRYTLIGALGITTADQDIDGRMPEMDIDNLHKQYIELYNQIIQLDQSRVTPMNPDNWEVRTGSIYVAAIGKARKILSDLTNAR